MTTVLQLSDLTINDSRHVDRLRKGDDSDEEDQHKSNRRRNCREDLGRLIKRGSFWLSGSSRSDLSGGPHTPDLVEERHSEYYVDGPDLPVIFVKVQFAIPYSV